MMTVADPAPAGMDAETLRLVALAFVPGLLFALLLIVRPHPVQRLSGRMSRWQLGRMEALGAPRFLRDHAARQARWMAGPAGRVVLRLVGGFSLAAIAGALFFLARSGG